MLTQLRLSLTRAQQTSSFRLEGLRCLLLMRTANTLCQSIVYYHKKYDTCATLLTAGRQANRTTSKRDEVTWPSTQTVLS